jgi:hypothetical protein
MSFPRQARAEELLAQLEPAYAVGYTVEIRCGHCTKRRLLDQLRIAYDPMRDAYQLVSMLPASGRPGLTVGLPSPGPGTARPSITRQNRVFSPLPGAAYQPWHYGCHGRCGMSQTVREERLTAAFLAAFHAGQTRLVLGVDL